MTAAVGVGGAGHEASELLGVPLVGAHEATVARGRLSVARVVARHFPRLHVHRSLRAWHAQRAAVTERGALRLEGVPVGGATEHATRLGSDGQLDAIALGVLRTGPRLHLDDDEQALGRVAPPSG